MLERPSLSKLFLMFFFYRRKPLHFAQLTGASSCLDLLSTTPRTNVPNHNVIISDVPTKMDPTVEVRNVFQFNRKNQVQLSQLSLLGDDSLKCFEICLVI